MKKKVLFIVIAVLLVLNMASLAYLVHSAKGDKKAEAEVAETAETPKARPEPAEVPESEDDAAGTAEQEAVEIEEPQLNAKSACIFRIDGPDSGTFIYEKNADEKRAQASTTKLMTAMLLIDSGKLEDSSEISDNAASCNEIYHELEEGDVYNNHDLMYAMLLPSANDAAIAIAEGVSGSEDAFVEMMNERAAEMGLNDTCYLNPHGLDQSGHYSTAHDVAVLTAAAYTYPEIREAWTYKTKDITSLEEGNTWELKSTTQILGYDDNFKGGKTGTQNDSGYCFTGVYEMDGTDYVTVVLGCDEEENRWEDTKTLHRYIQQYSKSKQ